LIDLKPPETAAFFLARDLTDLILVDNSPLTGVAVFRVGGG